MNKIKLKNILICIAVVLIMAVVVLFTSACDVNISTGRIKDFANDVASEITGSDFSLTPSSEQSIALPTSVDSLLGPYRVVRVVDGDTAILDIDGEEKRCRFIGIDTPESVHPDESKNSEEGIDASKFTKQLLTDQNVYIDYDVQMQDKYGRELIYIYLEDGRMVQDILLSEGMATTMTIQPNSKYASHFAELQQYARENSIGFWKDSFLGK